MLPAMDIGRHLILQLGTQQEPLGFFGILLAVGVIALLVAPEILAGEALTALFRWAVRQTRSDAPADRGESVPEDDHGQP